MSTRPCICRPTHRADDPICQWRPAAAAIDLSEARAAVVGVYKGSPAVSTATIQRGLTAALPHIERQVREQVAREIAVEAARRRRDADETAAARGGTRDPHQDAVRLGLDLAASIARGAS